MIKYIITKKCNRKCSYCISRNVYQKESYDLREVNRIFSELSKVDDSIMFTGGEPTLANLFIEKIFLASLKFKKVYLTTQNITIFKNKWAELFNAITFSLHDKKLRINPPDVTKNIPVYASILWEQFCQDLPEKLWKQGWSGLTISQEQRNGEPINESLIQEFPNFSIKINRKGDCLDNLIILPDLNIIQGFKDYL